MTRGALRWLLPALFVVAWLALGAVAGPYQGKLADVQTNDSAAFLPASAEATAVAEAQRRFAEEQVVPAIVVVERDGGVTSADVATLTRVIGAVQDTPGVAGPPSPPTTSDDGAAAQAVLPVLAESDQVADVVATLRTDLDGAFGDGASAYVTGPAGIQADFVTAFGAIDGLLLGVAALVVAVILVLVYRSPLLPITVLATAGLALSLAVFVVYQLAAADILTLNGQSQGILFILVFGAATDYALLLVSRHREELRRQDSVLAALRTAWRATLEPVLASAGTVIAGLLCLLLSDLNSTKGLGPVAAVGIAAAVLSTLTFLPAALALLGRAAFWPARPRLGDVEPQRGLWPAVAGLVGRRPRAVWVLTVLVLLGGVALAPQLRASGTAQTDVFRTEVESVAGQDVLAEHFAAGTGSPAVIIANATALDAVRAAAADVPGVVQVAARPDVVDGQVEITALLADPADSPRAENTVAALRDTLRAVPGADALVGGPTAVQLDTQTTSERDRALIIPIVLVVIALILALLLRSVVAPLVLIATVLLSFGATLGVAAVLFNGPFGFPGADPSVPLFAFVFLVALGVDYNIFLMTRVREESQRLGTRDGTLRALTATGGVITSAGVVLAATFAALAVVPILFLAQIAFLVAFGVLLDALLVRSLLVPALTVDIGRLIWWPSALSRTSGLSRRPRTDDHPSATT